MIKEQLWLRFYKKYGNLTLCKHIFYKTASLGGQPGGQLKHCVGFQARVWSCTFMQMFYSKRGCSGALGSTQTQ